MNFYVLITFVFGLLFMYLSLGTSNLAFYLFNTVCLFFFYMIISVFL